MSREVLVVAAAAPVSRGVSRRRLTAVRTRWRRVLLAVAAGAGTSLRWLFLGLLAVRGVAGLLLVAVGAGWAFHPAFGLIIAGAGLLADRALEEWRRAS